MIPGTKDDLGPWLGERLGEFSTGIHFLTRLPLPRHAPLGGHAVGQSVWAFPLAGVVVGLIGALVYALAHRLGLPSWPAAALAVAATLGVTGCLHDDGLADTADGFGGGDTTERKLDIMRDSRIGTYGVCALILALLLRVSALASIAATVPVGLALLAAHGAGRASLPFVMWLLPPARSSGLSSSAGRPPGDRVAAAAVLGTLILAICLHPGRGVVALGLVAIVVAVMAWLSNKQIDGQTGDVLGAVEQISEIAILLVAAG